MRNILLPSVAVLIAFAGLSAPVLAASLTDGSSDSSLFDESVVQQQLQAKGINAVDVAEWGDEIQATVLVNGHLSLVYFEPDTLKQIGANGQTADTTVLTRRDIGVAKPATGLAQSLITSDDASTTD
jgi:hypothetical protein